MRTFHDECAGTDRLPGRNRARLRTRVHRFARGFGAPVRSRAKAQSGNPAQVRRVGVSVAAGAGWRRRGRSAALHHERHGMGGRESRDKGVCAACARFAVGETRQDVRRRQGGACDIPQTAGGEDTGGNRGDRIAVGLKALGADQAREVSYGGGSESGNGVFQKYRTSLLQPVSRRTFRGGSGGRRETPRRNPRPAPQVRDVDCAGSAGNPDRQRPQPRSPALEQGECARCGRGSYVSRFVACLGAESREELGPYDERMPQTCQGRHYAGDDCRTPQRIQRRRERFALGRFRCGVQENLAPVRRCGRSPARALCEKRPFLEPRDDRRIAASSHESIRAGRSADG